MVKVDPTRNYYADLNVSANASENEIRKAFRALALQFHPDRNPGRETQVVVKFQEIQAANEILSDPTTRAKYDTERRKYRNLNIPTNTPNTPRTRPPPPPRNTYTTSTPNGSYYRAPPPKPTTQQPRPPPPQQYASYTSGADRFTSKNFRAPPTAQRPDTRAKDAEARANVFTAWQKMKQPRADESRPYNAGSQAKQNGQASQNSESQQQKNPNGTPFGRSQSTRVPSSRKGFDPGTPGGDEGQARSAYRNYARPAPTPSSSTTPPHPPPPPPPTNDTPTTQVPYAEGTRTRTPYYSSAAGERTSMFEGLGRSASVRNSPTGANRPNSSADPASYSDSGRRQQRNSYGGKPNSPFPHMYADSSEEESDADVIQKTNKPRGPPASRNPQPPPPPPPTWNQSGFGTPQNQQSNGTKATPTSFKSRSEESINMKFSPSDWHGKFESSADYFAPNMQKGASAKGRMSPTRGRPPQRHATDRNPPSQQSMGSNPASPFSQPQAQYQSYPIPPPPPGPPPNLNFPPPQAEPDVQAAKFKPEEWTNYFKEPSWVFSDQKETSPRRAPEAVKRPKAARKGSVAQDKRPRAQDQAGTSPSKKYQATADDAEKGDTDAMDIDPSTPPVQTEESANGQTPAGTMPNDPPATKPRVAGLNGVTTALVDDDTFIAPKTSSMGLNGVGDALPFPSESSKTHPTKSNTAQKLKFPNMPLPPALPTTYDQVFVDLYFSRFETYCKDYMKATKAMTTHFVARDAELAGNLDDRFAHHRGETTKKLGFASYLARMKEDEQVIETWRVYQQNHIRAMAQCEEVRNRSMKMYQTPVA
jgi:curved DNA-binding protein CbpA